MAEEWEVERSRRRRAACWSDGAASVPRNPLVDFAPFCKFDRNGEDLELIFAAPQDGTWTVEVATFVYSLTKANMLSLYNSTRGFEWKDSAKRAELADGDGRYVLARSRATGEFVGFISFRFLLEGVFDVLYLYELQLAPSVQRKGLGKHLMQLAELIARKAGMQL